MPVSIRIHESGQYVVATFRGLILDEDLRPAYEGFYADRSISIDLPELVDLSGADLSSLTHAGLSVFSRWAAEFLTSRGATLRKSARYIPGHLGRSKLILHEVLMQGSPEVSRAFSHRDEAVAWLLDATPESAVTQPTN